MRWSTRSVAVALVLAVVGLYARGLGGGFVIDDRTFFVENDDLTSLRLRDAGTVFLRSTNDWGDFQPVRDLLFLVEYRSFGRATTGYHVVSLVLYAAACLLAFALARELGGPRPPGGEEESGAPVGAALVAALFTVHPAHVEAVAYICGQKELLAGLFSLGALLLFQRALDEPSGRAGRVAAGAALYGLAILSKQTAVMLAALVPLQFLLADRARRPRPLPAALVWGAVNVPAALWMIRSREAFQALWGATSALNAVPLAERIPLALKVLGAHAKLAVLPWPLSFGYPFDASGRADANLLAGLVALLALGAAAWIFRRERGVLFGAACFLLFLVPVLQLHGSLNNASIFDRYLFLPVLGLALVTERLVRAVAGAQDGGPSRPALAVNAALLVAGAGLTLAYVPAFADDVAVTRNTYERFPGWSRAPFELAYSLVEAGRVGEARAVMAREPSLDRPPWVRPFLEGWALVQEGRSAEAVPALSWASRLAVSGGNFPFPSIPLGRALIATGRLREAETELGRALASPIHQPLERYHARELLRELARRRRDGGPPPP